MSDDVPDLRHHSKADVAKTVGVVVGVLGICITVATVIFAAGKNQMAIERIGRIEDKQLQQDSRQIRTEYEAAAANSGVQEIKSDIKDINVQLRQLNLTNHRR